MTKKWQVSRDGRTLRKQKKSWAYSLVSQNWIFNRITTECCFHRDRFFFFACIGAFRVFPKSKSEKIGKMISVKSSQVESSEVSGSTMKSNNLILHFSVGWAVEVTLECQHGTRTAADVHHGGGGRGLCIRRVGHIKKMT